MVLLVSEVFARHVSDTVEPAFLLKKFAEDLGDLVDDLNWALEMTGGTRDVFLNDSSDSVNLCLRSYPHRVRLSALEGVVMRGASVPDIVVDATLSFDPDSMKFSLYINRDPDGHYDEDMTQIVDYPLNDEGLQGVSVAIATLLNEYLELPEKMAYFRTISQKNAQAILSL